jgi:hypothetical protein
MCPFWQAATTSESQFSGIVGAGLKVSSPIIIGVATARCHKVDLESANT